MSRGVAEYFQVRSCVKYDDVQSTLNMQLISSQNNIIVPISGKQSNTASYWSPITLQHTWVLHTSEV
jgi:hypothetical protein